MSITRCVITSLPWTISELAARRADLDPPLCIAKMAHYAFGSNAPYELRAELQYTTFPWPHEKRLGPSGSFAISSGQQRDLSPTLCPGDGSIRLRDGSRRIDGTAAVSQSRGPTG